MANRERDQIVTNLLNRQLEMELVRSGFEDGMQTAFNYVNPRRYDMAGTRIKGAKRATKMYDGTAQDAFFDWVAGILGWGISESLDWHRAALMERRLRELDPVQRWLQDYTEQMDWEIRNGKFYDSLPEQLQDGGSGGTAVMWTEESRDLTRCVHTVPHPGSYWIAENSEHEVDVYHEQITLTARKALQKYSKPTDSMHPEVARWAQDARSALFETKFLQCVCPADDPAIFPNGNVTPGRKPWALVTILHSMSSSTGAHTEIFTKGEPGQRLIRLEPMDYFPPTVWRFRRNSDEIYGFSPAMDVMSIIEAAQQHAFNLLNMGNFASQPMMAIPEEKRGEFPYLPNGKFYYGSEKRLPQTIEVAREYPVAVEREDKIQALIRKRYGYHVWNTMQLYQQKRERVQAREIVEARADQARLLTGQFNNLWRGGVRPTYNNIAYIAGRAGRLPAAPNELQELRGKDVIIPMFVGPLSQIQIQSLKLGGLQLGLGLLKDVGEVVGRHIGPEEAAQLYARVRLPDLAEYICDHTGFPQSLMNDDETVKSIIEARQQRAAAQQEAAIARELAAASGQLGKEPGPHSLLARGAA